MLACVAVCSTTAVSAQRPRRIAESEASSYDSSLTGVYRINTEKSDRLYSVVSNASSNVPFGEQQRFFIDLTVRLTPPDQLAIRRTGTRIEIASSRAPRTTFEADGRERVERTVYGTSRERSSLAGESLVLSSTGSNGESYRVTFTPAGDGRELRVTRRISSTELNQPIVIQSVYDRVSANANWGVYGEPRKVEPAIAGLVGARASERAEQGQADVLRAALQAWVGATNEKDIGRQMTFYMPTLLAYYLTRNTPRDAVRAEKARVFARATRIDINADEPEVVFLEQGRVAVMRFRKRYEIEGGPVARRGEVVQELRWRNTDGGWKIYSERDIRVIR